MSLFTFTSLSANHNSLSPTHQTIFATEAEGKYNRSDRLPLLLLRFCRVHLLSSVSTTDLQKSGHRYLPDASYGVRPARSATVYSATDFSCSHISDPEPSKSLLRAEILLHAFPVTF